MGCGMKDSVVVGRSNFIADYYLLGKNHIGKGSFGEVRKAHLLNNHRIVRAAKMLLKSRLKTKDFSQLQEEVSILNKFDHPNIVRTYGVFEDYQHYYILTELLSDNLSQRYQKAFPLSQSKASTIIRQVLSALTACHSKGICHLDVKLQNIMIVGTSSQSAIKLVDFGLARFKNNVTNLGGSVPYIPPEVYEYQYSHKSDIWSTGVLMLILLTGIIPVNDSPKQISQKVSENIYPGLTLVSQEGMQLLKLMLQINPSARLAAEGCLKAKWIHQYISGGCVEQTIKRVSKRVLELDKQKPLEKTLRHCVIKCYIWKEAHQKEWKDFQVLDKDLDGVLSEKDLANSFEDKMVQKILNMCAKDEEGILYSEFLAIMTDLKELSEEGVCLFMDELRPYGTEFSPSGIRSIMDSSSLLVQDGLLTNPSLGSKQEIMEQEQKYPLEMIEQTLQNLRSRRINLPRK